MTTNVPAVLSGIGSALAAFGSGPDPFSQAGEELGAGNGNFLQFNGNTGEYTWGAGKANEIDHGTKVACNPLSFARGWICWKDSNPVEEMMIPLVQGKPPIESKLTDHGPYGKDDGWSEQVGFECVDGAGTAFIFKSSMGGSLRAFGNFMKDYGKAFRSNPGKVPLITLDAISYAPKEKKHGDKKYAPVFKIVDWVDEALAIPEAGASDEAEDPANYAQTGAAEVQPPASAVPQQAVVSPPAPPPPPPVVTPTPTPAPTPAPVQAPPPAQAVATTAAAPAAGGKRKGMRF